MQIYVNLFFLLLIFNLGCSKETVDLDRPEYCESVQEIVNDYIQEVSNKYGLKGAGSGGSMPFDVESIAVRFDKFENFESIEEERKILIELVNLLTKKVNEHKKIRPFLHKYPFPIEGSEVALSIECSNPVHEISFIAQVAGKFIYAFNNGNQYLIKFKETYDEAVKKNQEYLEKKKAVTSSSTE